MSRRRYIVVDKTGPLQRGHYDDTPNGGILVRGDHVTMFSYCSARRIIDRTNKYADKKGYSWDRTRRIYLLKVDDAK